MSKQCESVRVSRRTVLLGAAGAVPLIALGAAGAQAAAKLTKSAVNYQMEPHDGKHCSICNFYVAPSSCKQVDGQIFPNGYCMLWAAKA
jgi:hypothetical protein